MVEIPEDQQPSPEDLGEPQSNVAGNDDSLPDPFSPRELKKPRTMSTKEDQDEGDAQTMDRYARAHL